MWNTGVKCTGLSLQLPGACCFLDSLVQKDREERDVCSSSGNHCGYLITGAENSFGLQMGISLVPEDAVIPPKNSEKSARLASQVKRIDVVAKFQYKNLTLPLPVLNPSVAKYGVIHAVFIMSNPFFIG